MTYHRAIGDVVGYDKQGQPIFGPDAVQPGGGSFLNRTLTTAMTPKPTPSSGGFLDSIASAITSGTRAIVSAVTPTPARVVTARSSSPAWVLPAAGVALGLGALYLFTRKRRNPGVARGPRTASRLRAIRKLRHTRASKRLSAQQARKRR